MKLGMAHFDWDPIKNEWLKLNREISFDQILTAIETDGLLDIRDHPNQKRYGGQMELLVLVEEYVYVVPFVETKERIFLKTAFPSRKETKKYIKNKKK